MNQSMSPQPVASSSKSVSKACDRCRRRKARCDETTPCTGCVQAKTACEHTTPILKRGPRKKESPVGLDERIRTLEGLIASIATATPGRLDGLLPAEELRQIQLAAGTSPGYTSKDENPLNGLLMLGGDPIYDSMRGYEAGPSQPPSTMRSGLPSWVGQNHTELPFNIPPLPLPSTCLPNPSPRDLRYRDVQGQVKWLGPSSGMPLLDRLKPDTASTAPELSLPQEWISASTALGAGGIQPERLSYGSPVTTTSDDGALWLRLADICPLDLLDALIQGYFTVSHLTWPMLHPPTFSEDYQSLEARQQPTFVALVLSMCSLSSRFVADSRLSTPDSNGDTISRRIAHLAEETVFAIATQKSDLQIVQALLNMSIAQEGTNRPSVLWAYLGQALTTAMEIGLHRRVDEWDEFDPILAEGRKRTLWAIYAQQVRACCSFGRPVLLYLKDIDLDEPGPFDDSRTTPGSSYGLDSTDQAIILSGSIAAIRLHMVLERIITRINSSPKTERQGFMSLILPPEAPHSTISEESLLIVRVTEGLIGDWSFSTASILDSNNIRFFQKTRIFCMQHFSRLLMVRHEFSQLLVEQESASQVADMEMQRTARQITESALAITGAYSMVDNNGRLGYFGAHAIAQLTQAGAGLISMILYARTSHWPGVEDLSFQASQGLPLALQTLRQLGKRRIAGSRSAELLAEFSRICRIPIYTALDSEDPASVDHPVDVPMLRSLRRRGTGGQVAETEGAQMPIMDFGEWLNFSVESFAGWEEMTEGRHQS